MRRLRWVAVPTFIPSLQPVATISRHRYIHVIGSSVFVSDRIEIEGAAQHFLGTLDDEGMWAVDVPHGADPSVPDCLHGYS